MNKKGKVLNKKRVNTNEADILSFVRYVKGHKKLAFEEAVLSQWLYVRNHPEPPLLQSLVPERQTKLSKPDTARPPQSSPATSPGGMG